jgi:hypothetical protein
VEAGNIGMIVFTRFNYLEVAFALGLMICAFLFKDQIKWKKVKAVTLLYLFVFGLLYAFYLSPEISKLTLEMRDLMEGSDAYQAIEKRHLFYHQLYVRLDSVKLLILAALIGFSMKSPQRKSA